MKQLVPLAILSVGCLIYLVSSSDLQLTDWADPSASAGLSDDDSDRGTNEASAASRDEFFDSDPISGESPKLVLMKFGAPWCPPCRMIDKELRKLGRTNLPVEIRKIDVDERPQMAERYGVSSIPRLILLQDGRKIGDAVGYQSAEDLSQWIRENASAEALAGEKRSAGPAAVQANPFFK
ncbi:Thioredoxin [Stieleria maiorica]|uniref:Thioredoxin n=1 Tax=Stieleria maiorica TaxID=2795974 RepID=A0A5B9MDF3_9BACT|nr:thioredoxin family protein [Stieleria maiorica]QEF98813.1 Thioredoxin [Stieleria maiorica]